VVQVTDTGKFRTVVGTRDEVVTQLSEDNRKPGDVIVFEFDGTDFYAVYQNR
jgi:hypothetical protein